MQLRSRNINIIDMLDFVLVKAFTAGINVHGVFRAGGPWPQDMSS